MLIKKPADIRTSEITPRELYLGRREFILEAGTAGIGLAATGAASGFFPSSAFAAESLRYQKSPLSTQGEELTPLKAITNYNNFYEFGTGKEDPSANAGSLRTRPWTVTMEEPGVKPRVYDIDQVLKLHPSLEERVYRMRCVEGWSMVIPWIGIPLQSVIKAFAPGSKASYVAFETLKDTSQMPGQKRPVMSWPYVEGLRMDEALHPLTILAVGLYGEVLPNQNGAPLRLVVPWKYGFKSIKSIVKIRFVERQPPTSWNKMQPDEYGFYSNVNPSVDHPRWSQAKERRIGEFFKRATLMFNGYADQVGSMYSGMDLRKYY
jgi:methionine sulfoxide reductase catalytic subunit